MPRDPPVRDPERENDREPPRDHADRATKHDASEREEKRHRDGARHSDEKARPLEAAEQVAEREEPLRERGMLEIVAPRLGEVVAEDDVSDVVLARAEDPFVPADVLDAERVRADEERGGEEGHGNPEVGSREIAAATEAEREPRERPGGGEGESREER